jgi:hypothetical protein
VEQKLFADSKFYLITRTIKNLQQLLETVFSGINFSDHSYKLEKKIFTDSKLYLRPRTIKNLQQFLEDEGITHQQRLTEIADDNKALRHHLFRWYRHIRPKMNWRERLAPPKELIKLLIFDIGISHIFADICNLEVESAPNYSGPVYCLINRNTFSSAVILATILQDNGRATLIGERPSNKPNFFAHVREVVLVESGIALDISSIEMIRPNVHKEELEIAFEYDQGVELLNSSGLRDGVLLQRVFGESSSD